MKLAANNKTSKKKNKIKISIWLENLAEYNAGRLVGDWISLPIAGNALQLAYDKITNSSMDEYFIADYSFDSGGPSLKKLVQEYECPFALNSAIVAINKLSPEQRQKINFLVEFHDLSYKQALKEIDDVTIYNCDLEEVAYQLVKDGVFGHIEPSLAPYVDYAYLASDLKHSGYFYDSKMGASFHYMG